MAAIKDLTNKMFVFPEEGDTAHVKLTPKVESLSAVTVCHRSFTDLKRDYGLFSLAVPNESNGFLTFIHPSKQAISVNIQNPDIVFGGVNYAVNKWHSICTTWNSNSGLVQVWLDGQPLTMKSAKKTPLCGKPIVILGQEQDSYGGKFDAKQSFMGMMTDVHMWDRVLSPSEIQRFMQGQSFAPGNVLNWAALDCEISGRVLIEDKQTGF